MSHIYLSICITLSCKGSISWLSSMSVRRQYGCSVVGEVFCVTSAYLSTTATPAITWLIASLPDHSFLSAVEVFLKEVLIGHFYLVILGNTF